MSMMVYASSRGMQEGAGCPHVSSPLSIIRLYGGKASDSGHCGDLLSFFRRAD